MSKSSVGAGAQSRVLLVTRNLPPLRGGMERLNRHMAVELAHSFRVQVIGPAGCRDHLPDTIEVAESPVHPLWRFLLGACHRTWRLARSFQPVMALAGSGLTAPFAVLAARLAGGYSAVYAHGLDLVVRNALYRRVWLPFIRRCDLCIVNSRNTAKLAREAGVQAERIAIVHPGVTMPDEVGDSAGVDFRHRHGLRDAKVLLSVGRLTPRKGLQQFVERALPQIVMSCPRTVLVVIGDEAPDALSGSGAGAGERLAEYANEQGLAQHVRMLGVCDDQELSAAYAAADLCIFPVRAVHGDVEGFGMVAIEAAAHGLPTVAFEVGGVSDAIADGRSGWVVPAGDYARMSERVVQALKDGRSDTIREQCRSFAESFAWHRFGARLRALIDEVAIGPGYGDGRAP